ncbi:MAG: hypothetical protein JXA46_07145 [Dehalococcoidales bacterium]|nr:hypothetical protein [Dehalococcoidales bacterium]
MAIPNTYVCSFFAFDRFQKNDPTLIAELRHELEQIYRRDTAFSVRSSANLEDGEAHSFAGQFRTVLNVNSVDEILDAVTSVWESTTNDVLQSYLENSGKQKDGLRMAVIIQEMVVARYSGIVFSRNPVTGMDEVIIEAVRGAGDGLHTGNVPLQRWTYKWGHWLEKPDTTIVDEEVILTIITESQKIATRYGKPVDLEWAYDGITLYWLQLRPITTIRNIDIYSNKISREFLPGMIKPLVWSINIPVVNGSWKKLLMELLGKDASTIDVHALAKSIYYRAYFNMGIMGDMFELLGMPRELLEVLMGIEIENAQGPRFRPGMRAIKYMPRMIGFVMKALFFKHVINRFLQRALQEYETIRSELKTRETEKSIIAAIDGLFDPLKEGSYFVIVTSVLMGVYSRLAKHAEKNAGGNTFTETGFFRRKLNDIDPTYQLGLLHDLYEHLPEAEKRQFSGGNLLGVAASDTFNMLTENLEKFLHRFGHLSDSGNDFSKVHWIEDPALVINMIINTPPQSDPETPPETGFPLPSQPIHRFILLNAVDYQELKERVNFVYTFGYSIFRDHFKKLGNLWKEKDYISEESDIFYLTYDEIKNTVHGSIDPGHLRELCNKRQTEMEELADISLPATIIGDQLPPIIRDESLKTNLHGVPASRGQCTGRIVVVRSSDQFDKVRKGDIIVIPYSDISWTPLFPKAKGIIAESGGMLSHCSIVAREYGIPAVVSVSGAMDLPDGTCVSINGDRGEVLVLDIEPPLSTDEERSRKS